MTEGAQGRERVKCVDVTYLDKYGEIATVRKRLRIEGKPWLVWRRGNKVDPVRPSPSRGCEK